MTHEEALKKLVDILEKHGVRKFTCINGFGYSPLEREIVSLFIPEFQIGDKVRIPKGNAGFGITGIITNVLGSGQDALYFVNDYNEALFDFELEHI